VLRGHFFEAILLEIFVLELSTVSSPSRIFEGLPSTIFLRNNLPTPSMQARKQQAAAYKTKDNP
jgi:hypothetical protein